MIEERRLKQIHNAIMTIAAREGVTIEYVRNQMEAAIFAGLHNNNPWVQANWKSIPYKGELPTPEEFITFFADEISK